MEKKRTTTAAKSKPRAKAKPKQMYYEAVGRRKTSVARVRVMVTKPGKKSAADDKKAASSPLLINEKPFAEYFRTEELQRAVEEPLKKLKSPAGVSIVVKVSGGGVTGQAEATRLGIARALKEMSPELLPELRVGQMLTRDPRMKERKKPGLKGARRGQQWSKR